MTDGWDIAVIGAGPAGTTAARLLAAGGRRVLLLERETLPRHKPCGGGLPPRTLAALGLQVPAELLHAVTEVALDGGLTGRQLYPLSGGTFVVDRARFDAYLAREAVAAGVVLWEKCPVTAGRREADNIALTTVCGPVRARQVVVAAGAFPRVAADLGFAPNVLGLCMDVHVPIPATVPDGARHRAIFNLRALRYGYGWCFPRGDTFVAGVGGAYPRRRRMPQDLLEFCRCTPELRSAQPGHGRGAMIPNFATPRSRYADAGVYLVGDTAGLVDPLTGEGIHYAVQSARLAAAAVLSGGGEGAYDAQLRTQLLPDLVTGARYARLFHGAPPWLRGCCMMLPGFRRCACRFVQILEGQRAYADLF